MNEEGLLASGLILVSFLCLWGPLGHWPHRALWCPEQHEVPRTIKGQNEKAVSAEDSRESDAMSEEGARTHIWRTRAGPGAPGSVSWPPGM